AMGKALGLTVVAEGVETLAQEDFLRALDCDQTQGYYFSRPLPQAQLAQLLARSASAAPLVGAA
ncbi:MAG: EAL domain-containing protein, partial [Rubrivivax sp.]|nr:EAL domain-containing protein [Rubrivivax sp.]